MQMNTNAKGKWTTEHGEERSITDCVIASQEYMETIKSIENDEEKQYELYKLKRQNKQMKNTYSHQNAILTNVDFISPEDVSRKKKVFASITSTKQQFKKEKQAKYLRRENFKRASSRDYYKAGRKIKKITR